MQLALSGFDAQLDAAACTPADTRRDAKEDLERRPDGQVLASMTLQRFLRGYSQRCGMTGTAQDAASELRAFYGLDVMAVPTHRPLRRVDRLDLVFTHRAAKETAVVEEVVRAHATGRPVLVGTLTVEQTERIAAAMRTRVAPSRSPPIATRAGTWTCSYGDMRPSSCRCFCSAGRWCSSSGKDGGPPEGGPTKV